MFSSSPKTFNEAIAPLVHLNCRAGMGMFRQENQSDASYFCINLFTASAALVNWIAIYFTFTSMVNNPTPEPDTSPMARIMYTIIICTNSFCITVIAPCLVWLRRKGLRDCLRRMSILDETFEALSGARMDYRREYKRLTRQVIAVFLTMASVIIYDATWTFKSDLSTWTSVCIIITLHHPIFVMFVLDLDFSNCVRYLGKKFENLNSALLKLAKTPDADDANSYNGERLFNNFGNGQRQRTQRHETRNTEYQILANNKQRLFQDIRKAHLELCKLTRRINAVFGVQNLLSMGISFGMITGLLYTIYSALDWKHAPNHLLYDILPSAMWAAIYIFKILMISHSCWSVSNEAQRMGEVLYELLKLKVEKVLQPDQIRLFAQQMLQNPVRFDACGFFTLDYTFVQGAIGSITTYLVILIQMSNLSQPTTTAGFNLHQNNTAVSAIYDS